MSTLLILIFCIALGYIASSIGMLPESLKNALHKYVYFIAVPFAIIYSLSNTLSADIGQYASFITANFAAYLAVFLAVSTITLRKKYSHKLSGVIRFSSSAPNTVFLGFPLILALYDYEFFVYAVILGSLLDTVLNTIRIIAIQKNHKQTDTHSTNMMYLKNFINPLSVALLIACIIVVTQFELPEVVESVFGAIGKTSMYVALFVMGSSLYGLRLNPKHHTTLVFTTLIKLFVLPLVVLAFCILFSVGEEARNISVIVSALPSAVFSLIVAKNLRLDEELAASIVLVTTVLSPITIFVWYVLLQYL